MKNILLLIILTIIFLSFKSDKPAYQLFDIKGKKIHYSALLEEAGKADIILFGELHDNPISHWLEQELTRDLYAVKKENLILSAEMFEADDQIVLDEYLSGAVSEKTFKDEAKLWTNFSTDYKPLLDFAKKNRLRFVAANVPRRYANMVYSRGMPKLDSIDSRALAWIAPLPIPYDSTLTCYKNIVAQANGHNGQNLPMSQAIKDATMAHFILKNFKAGKTVIHYNGSYHSDLHQGIEWYLKKQVPNLRVFTVGSSEQNDIDELEKENIGQADCIICVPLSMSKSYRP